MNQELAAIQTEQQLIEVIGAHIISQLDHQRRLIEKGDTQTFFYMSGNIQTFIFQSELAYQSVFPSVDIFLEKLRSLFSKTLPYHFGDDCLIKHDHFVSKVQTILKSSLETLDSFKVKHETEQVNEELAETWFINMSDERVINAIERIFKAAQIEIDRMSVHGINFKWLNDYLKCYADELIKNLPSEFNQFQYAQIIDIALSRISAAYILEAA
jgi:hypothetical protein